MTDRDIFLERVSEFSFSFARDLRPRPTGGFDAPQGPEGPMKAAVGSPPPAGHQPDRRATARPSLSGDEQIAVEGGSRWIQDMAAVVGAFDPKLARSLLVRRLDPRLARICMARLSNVCLPVPKKDGERWLLRASARRRQLSGIAETDAWLMAAIVSESEALADRRDPFTRALRAAIQGRAPAPWQLRPRALAATLAALEFAHPVFTGAPDPSRIRRGLLRREVRTRPTLRTNVVSRWFTFGAFIRRPEAGPATLALSGGTPEARTERLRGIRAAYFGDQARPTAYLDFRRPLLGTGPGGRITQEIATQFLQQGAGDDLPGRTGPEAARAVIEGISRSSRNLIVLCDGYDLGEDIALGATELRALADMVDGARWRFILAVSEEPADWGRLPPDARIDLSRPARGSPLNRAAAAEVEA